MPNKKDNVFIRNQVNLLRDRYNFKGLLHFTDFSNLSKILDDGYLRSRNECERMGIDFIDGANHSVLDRADDYIHNCVRFYYRGSTPTLYKNEGVKLKQYCESIHIPIPVYLLFDEELLYLDNTYFTNGNATNSERGNDYEFFWNMDWDAIFHHTYFECCDRDYIVNKRQAELLSEDAVSLKYLKKIIFRCEADKKRAINLFGEDKRYEVDISLFSDKDQSSKKLKNEEDENNFIDNYEIKYYYDSNSNKKRCELVINYKKNWRKYKTKILVKDMRGKYIQSFKMKYYFRDWFIGTYANSIDQSEAIVIELEGDIEKWSKIEVYVNDILYIEEFPIKDTVEKYKFTREKDSLIMYTTFKNLSFKNYENKVKIFDKQDKIVYISNISFKSNFDALSWKITLKNYDESWYKVNYYVNDALCISYIRRN